jgi:hemoglobin
MNELQKNTILAYRIGLYLIAVIVNEFYDQLRTDPELVEPFRVVNTWSDHKAQLTYFWWVTLGGNPAREMHGHLPPVQIRSGLDSRVLDAWLALFRRVALSLIDRELAETWMKTVSRITETCTTAASREQTLCRICLLVPGGLAQPDGIWGQA